MQNQLEDRAYAGFFVRTVAFMVDFVIAAMVGGMLKAPFSTAAALGLYGLTKNFLFQYSFVDVVGYLGQAAYFVLMTWLNHATLGKMLMRLEVVTEGKDWTFVNVLYRETVGRFLSSILMVGYLVVLGHSKKQGFHDMLCDTFVVYKNMSLRSVKPEAEPVAALPGTDSGITTSDSVPEMTGTSDMEPSDVMKDRVLETALANGVMDGAMGMMSSGTMPDKTPGEIPSAEMETEPWSAGNDITE